MAVDVRNQSSLFRWSRLLNSWLNCMPVISKGVSGDIVFVERVSIIGRVSRAGGGHGEVLLHVHVSLFSASCAVAVR